MLNKAKIVNISLNSPKNIATPPIHLTRQNQNQRRHILHDLKVESILKDCIEAINTISTQKKQNIEKEKKATKIITQGLKEAKKTDKQPGIKLPINLVDSIEMILKKFVFMQIQEKQQKMNSSYSRQRKNKQNFIKLNKNLLLNTTKQNNQNQNLKSIQASYQFIWSPSKLDKNNERLLNKIHALQTEIVFYKQKLSKKSNLIARYQNNHIMMKKKYQSQIIKMIRYKNILNISSLFQKECEQKDGGKYLMNINGTNLQLKRDLHSSETAHSSINRSLGVYLNQEAKVKTAKLQKRALITSPTQPVLKTTSRKQNYQNNQITNNQRSFNSLDISAEKDTLKVQSEKNKQISRREVLKQELEQLYKQKQKSIEILNENSNKLQKYIEDLDTKIMQKMKQINTQEELLTDEQLKMLKDEDFETLQLSGFYDTLYALPASNFQ